MDLYLFYVIFASWVRLEVVHGRIEQEARNLCFITRKDWSQIWSEFMRYLRFHLIQILEIFR